MKFLLIPAMALALSGCAQTLGPLLASIGVDPAKAVETEDKVIGTAVRPVPVYCNAPGNVRDMFRARVNEHPNMLGNEVGVWCVGDPPLVLGAPEPAPVPPPAPVQ